MKTGCRLWINSFFTAILVMLHCRKVESKQEQFRYCLRVLYTILTESIAIDFVSAIIRGGCKYKYHSQFESVYLCTRYCTKVMTAPWQVSCIFCRSAEVWLKIDCQWMLVTGDSRLVIIKPCRLNLVQTQSINQSI